MLEDKFNPAEDSLSEAEKLEKYSGEVEWSYLRPHFEAGNLIYVDPCLDLKKAGIAFAEDAQEQVQIWLKGGDLVQPCRQHAEYWESAQITFHAMIVRPFILAQPVESAETHA